MENVSGIYKISSKIKPERCYIGSAVNIKQRWGHHRNDLDARRHRNSRLQRHYNKYTRDDLLFEILLTCEKEKLIEKEQFFIDALKPWFNISPTAGNSLGVKHTLGTRRNMSKAMMGNKKWLGRHHTPEAIEKMRQAKIGHIPWNKGIPHSEETIKKIRESNIGRTAWNKGKTGVYSEEALKRMSEARVGKHPTEETRRKNSLAHMGNKSMLGKHHTPESKEKLRQYNLGKHHTEASRQKMSESNKGNKKWLGKHHSNETKNRMSENNGRNKLIINLETGIFYRSVTEAAISMGKKRYWLSSRLTGKTINASMFRYADMVKNLKKN